MKILRAIAAAAALLLTAIAPAVAQPQSAPHWTYGYVPTPAEWDFWWGKKVDWAGAPYCPTTGCTYTGPIITSPPTTLTAGITLPPGTAPTTPNNGDVWVTASGIFAQINGVTVQLASTPPSGALIVTSAAAQALAVGPNGATNPAFSVDASAGSLAAGVGIVGNAAGSGVSIRAISSAADETINLNGKGAGSVNIGNVSTGGVFINNPTTVTSNTAACLAAGPNGNTNPVLRANCAAGSSATGIVVNGAAAGSGVAIAVLSSGVDEGITVQAKGNGSITFTRSTAGNVTVNVGVSGSIGGQLTLAGSSSGAVTLVPAAAASGTVTIPAGTYGVVGDSLSQTLTNKIITASTNSIGGVTMSLGSDAQGDIYYRGPAGVLTRLAIGSNSQILTVSSNLPSWQPGTAASTVNVGTTTVTGTCSTLQLLFNNAGTTGCENAASVLAAGTGISLSGTTTVTINNTGVTSAVIAAGYGVSLSGTCTITTTGTCTEAVSLSQASNVLGADVNMSSTNTYFDGPSMAQGSTGTWFASGTVSVSSAAQDDIFCKLWDGSTVISSAVCDFGASIRGSCSMSGTLASPAGNIRISCKDVNANTSKIEFNRTGNSKDSSVWGVRIQ